MTALIQTERPQKVASVAASLKGVTHRYGKTVALDSVTLEIPGGCMAGLIGPDGVGKSTLLGLVAGVRKIQTGEVRALDGDLKDAAFRQGAFARIAYMPQGLGRNLYPTLSVFENMDFIGRLFGQGEAERKARIDDLTRSTGLDPFLARPAGKLSGGMKQKLSLCCSLIHDPDLLILDEPTTGVDPLSRRQFWELIDRIRARRPQMSVVVATAYMDEAEQYAWLAAMDGGHVIATGSPAEIKNRAGAKDLESAFIALLPEEKRKGHKAIEIPPRKHEEGPPAIEAVGLTKRFDKFVAVDHVSFKIEKGEIFGFLGSNGCGKSTTMKMLTGLLPPTEGTAKLFGEPVSGEEDIEMRRRVGYMSQAFSLYGELSVRRNLELHAKLFDLPVAERGKRVDEMLDRLCVQRRLACSAGERPAGARVRSPVVWIAGWRETKTLKPIDNVSLGETTSHRAVTTVNAKVASKVRSPEGRVLNRRAKAAWGSRNLTDAAPLLRGWKRQHGGKDMPSNWRSPPRPGAKSPEQGRSYNRLNREVDRRREGDGWVRSSVEAG